jgi:hypothetical protein
MMTRISATTHQMNLPRKRQQPMGTGATTQLECCLWLPQEVRATFNFVQMDNTSNRLYEIGNNKIFGKADLISALINQNFPCIECNNHKNINNPSAWFPVFLWKSGIATWKLFDVNLPDICNELVWDGDGGLGNMWVTYNKCPDVEFIQRIRCPK